MSEIDPGSLAAELDELHRQAKESFRQRDVAGTMGIFARDLRYRQANGSVISWDDLARDVAAQLAKVESAASDYTRESLQVDGERAIEVLEQRASVTMRRFLIFQSVLRVERRGRYLWTRTPGGWRIREVEILHEQVLSGKE
ncbi:MAG TPA: nuclear transport factor 2 family protein [Candidatus Polarisedimenticolia bacterium]|nr:nuclear transport factor 2 family protein [Candidatus Polarisedimenticolia bacterium]